MESREWRRTLCAHVCMCVCCFPSPCLLAEVATPHVNACKSLLPPCLHYHCTPPLPPPPPPPPPPETMSVNNNQRGGEWTLSCNQSVGYISRVQRKHCRRAQRCQVSLSIKQRKQEFRFDLKFLFAYWRSLALTIPEAAEEVQAASLLVSLRSSEMISHMESFISIVQCLQWTLRRTCL